MARLGRRHKRKMQGTSNYVKKPIPTTLPTHTPSNKRLRLQCKRQGGPDAAIEKSTPFQPEQLQSLHASLRHAINYIYIYLLDAPHEEHWGEGRHNFNPPPKTQTSTTHPPQDPPHTFEDS